MDGIEVLEATGRGTCSLCGSGCPHAEMAGHIRGHFGGDGPEPSRAGEGRFVIRVAGDGGPFWMFLEMVGSRRLSDLDAFLRKEWLECCGHGSSFFIGGSEYCSDRHADGALPMGRRLDRALHEGAEFRYEYDFGSTTALSMAVVEAGVPAISGGRSKVAVLARNDTVTFLCSRCGSKAVYVCGDCGLWDGGAHCYRCAPKHGCGMETMLPAAQSPRAGVCAYNGKKPDGRARYWVYTGGGR